MKHLMYLLATSMNIFSACSHNQNTHEKTDSSRFLGYYKIEGDSLIIPKFEIEVKLNEKTEDKILADKESIIVRAIFEKYENDLASIKNGYIVVKEIELIDSRIAKFQNIKISRKMFESLKNKDILLIINVVTGRKSSKDNLIHCDLLQDNMSKIKNKRFIIKGSLIDDKI